MSVLADVRDLDCVRTLAPLVFDLSAREVIGAAAVLRRILYRWCSARGSIRHAPAIGLVTPLVDLDGATFDAAQLDGLRAALVREALDEDFVDNATVALTLTSAGSLLISARITLVDGRSYPLEVLAGAASAALLAIGAS